jgi:hypothetical protein
MFVVCVFTEGTFIKDLLMGIVTIEDLLVGIVLIVDVVIEGASTTTDEDALRRQ